jgi:predicted PurR-regulated permease PerM
MVIGIIMGFGNLIPYFGPILGYAATVIVCLPDGNYIKMVTGLVIIAIIMFIDGNVINPKLLSDNINVHPLLVVAALLGGGVIGGIAGMLVAVPTAALLKLQFDRHLQKLEDLNKEKSGPESAKTA